MGEDRVDLVTNSFFFRCNGSSVPIPEKGIHSFGNLGVYQLSSVMTKNGCRSRSKMPKLFWG
jgi:hypothetical protein